MSFYPHRNNRSLDRAATLSQDVQSLQAYVALGETSGWGKAFELYHRGAFCQSYAELTLSQPLNRTIGVGTSVSAGSILGVTQEPAGTGDTSLRVRYVHASSQDWTTVASSPPLCSVGGNPNPNLSNCFEQSGQLDVASDAAFTIDYREYNPSVNTANAISLRSISLDLPDYVPTSPLVRNLLNAYETYYGKVDYADQWIRTAFQRSKTTSFVNGQQDFSAQILSEEGVNGTLD